MKKKIKTNSTISMCSGESLSIGLCDAKQMSNLNLNNMEELIMESISLQTVDNSDAMSAALKDMDATQRLNVFMSVLLSDDALEETEAQSAALRDMSQTERNYAFLGELFAEEETSEVHHGKAA